MARFPKPEAEIAALAEAMETGLTANAAIYPAPPVAPLDLTTLKNIISLPVMPRLLPALSPRLRPRTKMKNSMIWLML